MNNDEYYKYEDRVYINPTLSSGEQEEFINNFRDVQDQNNAQINEQTTNLGTDVPSNLGGLGGGGSYFSSRYQTPQVNDMVSNLKAASQAQALNNVMSNYQAQLQNKYQQAYRKYQSRERKRLLSSYGGGTGGGGGDSTKDPLKIKTNDGGKKSGGFWDSFLGKWVYNSMNDVINNGSKVNKTTGGEKLKILKNGMLQYTPTGEVLTTPSSDWSLIKDGGGATLGVWPNGKKMTDGSKYTYNGNTYISVYDSKGNRNIYQVYTGSGNDGGGGW